MTVHLFGGVWSPSCANFALKRTAIDYASEFDTDICQTVNENFYVDDCFKPMNTVQEAFRIVEQTSKLVEKGGFKLTKWTSTSEDVLQSVPAGRRAIEPGPINVNFTPAERALGVQWDTVNGTFGFQLKTKERPDTRRGLMSIVASVYDPFGFACPFVLQATKLLQNECKSGKDWEEPLEAANQHKWHGWLKELPKLDMYKLDRCVATPNFGPVVKCQLHHFADASLDGYGTASYLQVGNSSGRVHCALLMGKARLAPIKQMTKTGTFCGRFGCQSGSADSEGNSN